MASILHAVRPFLANLIIKWYEKDHTNMPQEQVTQSMNNRLTSYITICCMGLGNMYWGGATAVLSEMYNSNSDQAYYCVIYFQTSLLLMLLGVTAGTFPSSSPLAVFFSGLGAWQAVMFMLSSFHLAMLDYHPKPKIQNTLFSFGVTSILFTMYWACSAQDPLFLHVIAKLVGWLLYGIYFLLSWLLKLSLCSLLCCIQYLDDVISHVYVFIVMSCCHLYMLISKGVGVLSAQSRTRGCQPVPPAL